MFIKLCKKYSKHKKFYKKLRLAYPDTEIKIKSCIGMCKSCKTEPCAIVNGKKTKSAKISKFIESLS